MYTLLNGWTASPNGIASECHGLSLTLWQSASGEAKVWNGFALSSDGLWRAHSWVFCKGFIEVTPVSRDAYFGFELTESESENFYNYYFK